MKLFSITLPSLCLLASVLSSYSFGALQLSAQQTSQLQGICQASGPGFATSSLQTGIVIVNREGKLAPEHANLNARYRAESVAAAGLVMCLETTQQVLETCTYSVFFQVPRIRQDYRVTLVAARDPARVILSSVLPGATPQTCAQAGQVNASNNGIHGATPQLQALEALLVQAGISGDQDLDGSSDLAELINGTDPLDNSDPGLSLSVELNGQDPLTMPEGESLSLTLNFNPAALKGLPADYYLWVETRNGRLSYQHPDGFIPTDERQLSVRAKAARLDQFEIARLPAIGTGDYTVHFEVEVNGQLLQDTATLQINVSQWTFSEVSVAAGLVYQHGYSKSVNDISLDRQYMAAGVAAGDYDRDGWVDLYVTRGSSGANGLYRNRGDGTFAEVAVQAGVAVSGQENSGATFADYDGDGWLDLLVTGINTTTQPLLFHNQQDGTFSNATSSAGLPFIVNSMGSSFADYDRDGDLDFWVTHWTADLQGKYLFRNNGNGSFTDVSTSAGIPDGLMSDYTANFADINNDRWPDLLISGDFGSSQIFMNQGNGRFLNTTSAVISDENGMGGAVGDYDNDGDLDWFVTSIFDSRTNDFGLSRLNWGKSGNRFYQNLGNGTFTDVTTTTATGKGGWGWGACMADFNNDGFLDVFHVNGYSSLEGVTTAPFEADPSRLYISDQHGGFLERAVELGIDDRQQGRGIVCFDYDRDGDIDLFVANNRQAPLLYQNQGLHGHWLQVKVAGEASNSEAIGARIYISVNGQQQMRELSAGSNYMSQNPVLAHFGLGQATIVDEVRVVWPSGDSKTLSKVSADQLLYITK